MRSSFVVAVCIIIAALPASAQTETSCSITAFVADPTRAVNIRAGVSPRFPIVKTISKGKGGTMFDIVGTRGGWFKVELAQRSEGVLFSGVGWIPAGELAIKEKRGKYKVFEAPSERGRKIDVSLFDHVLPLVACKGEWVRVRLPGTGTELGTAVRSGWMPPGSYCGNPWLECD